LEKNIKPVLEIKDLAISYGQIKAVKKVDLEIFQNEFVVLLGGNGSGKSTLLNGIIGKLHANRGSITFMGRDITKSNPESIVASGISIVPEGRGVLGHMTILENLELGAYYVKHNISKDLDRIFALFPILAERRKQLAGTLSGGQQQMLVIGRALMSSPKLLLMDEPSLGLAPIMVNTVYDVILELKKNGQTILLAEQNARQALKYADRGYIFDLGTSVFNGTSQELANDDRVQQAYLGDSGPVH
jgi:branched-chain amino acid transport system ATP-binding protein